MSERFTKFNSNYLMRSQHQKTDLGTVLERDWVTTNGLNVLRFGAGRRIWYNSGNFVFTTSNIPTYHKKHKLTTEIKEWKWDDCKSADDTVNKVAPNFNSADLRDYAYYGSCVELIRATIEEIISDFPGRLVSTDERPSVYGENVGDVDNFNQIKDIKPITDNISYVEEGDIWYFYNGSKWIEAEKIVDEIQGKEKAGRKVGDVCYDLSDGQVKKCYSKEINGNEVLYFENFGIPTSKFKKYYAHEEGNFYAYDYSKKQFKETSDNVGLVDGFILENQFNIDLHHKKVILDKYDNPMRFMSQTWGKYCVIEDNGEPDDIVSFTITDEEEYECPSDNEGRILKNITIKTKSNKTYIINCYYVNRKIVYVYKPTHKEVIVIQPQQEYIDEYFFGLKGFKRQLLRQDSNPFYTNRFITPTEYNFNWYYPEKTYVWPSNGYCIDVTSSAFSSFIDKMYDLGQSFDELWSDNLYRSMTHESIKNFDWTYSREYYEGDEQDNIDGGERMQKILRIFGRVFDDVKVYIDSLKLVRNTTYDKRRNGPEALLSDENNMKGLDVISTISDDYDIDASITKDSLNSFVVGKDVCWPNKDEKSKHKKWYPTKNSNDVYVDVCDNEMMRRFLLSIKRMMQTKGTQQAIEMMFGMFGFGRGVDYDIEEEAYYTEKIILSDECVDGSMDGDSTHKGENWVNTPGVNWKEVNSHKKGDLAQEINLNKDLSRLYYDDTLSGIPLREVLLGRENTPYIVPYYDNTQLYDGNLIFQGKGGWGKFLKRNDQNPLDDCFDYQETLSYLHVVGTISDMLSINPYTVENNTIYYVVNLNDYSKYDENPPIDISKGVTMSHYFILINKYETHKLYSWKNIVVKNELDIEGKLQMVTDKSAFQEIFGVDETQDWAYNPDYLKSENPTDEEKLGTYIYAFAKMVYLDNILSTNVANNPHVGYGNYDDGKTFMEYMKLPFKYLIDNRNIENPSLGALAKKYDFGDFDKRVNDKIQLMNTRKVNGSVTDFVEYEIKGENINTKYKLSEPSYNTEKRWYINTKVLTITNLIKNSPLSYKVIEEIKKGDEIVYNKGAVLDGSEYNGLSAADKKKCVQHRLYDCYFKSIIMPYVMQVIPSTTILKLKNFSE